MYSADLNYFFKDNFNLQLFREIQSSISKLNRLDKTKKLDEKAFLISLIEGFNYVNIHFNDYFEVAETIESWSVKSGARFEYYMYLIRLLCNELDPELNISISILDGRYEDIEAEEFPGHRHDDTAKKHIRDYHNHLNGQPGIVHLNDGAINRNAWSLAAEKKAALQEREARIATAPVAPQPETDQSNSGNKFITERQQGMVFYYLNSEFKISSGVDMNHFALFVEWVLNKRSPKIENSNYYKYLCNPLKHKKDPQHVEAVLRDLEVVRVWFERISIPKIVEHIDMDIRKLRNTLSSYEDLG